MLVLQEIKLTYAHVYVFFLLLQYHINQNNKVVVCKYSIQYSVQELTSFYCGRLLKVNMNWG